MDMIDFSIIVTLHNEGEILQNTIASIQRGLDLLKMAKINFEIILHVDNGDPATKKIVADYANISYFKIFNNHFADPGAARNFSINQSSGKIIAILDGDDLVTKEWLHEGYLLVRSSQKPIVAHSEFNLSFGARRKPHLWVQNDSSIELTDDVLVLAGRNKWSHGIILRRELALKFPYKESNGIYGYEDWSFNLATRAAGVAHRIIPGSMLFYRVKDQSVFMRHNDAGVLLPYDEILSLKNLKIMKAKPTRQQPHIIKLVRNRVRAILSVHSSYIIYILSALQNKKVFKQNQNTILEWEEMAKIEKDLASPQKYFKEMSIYRAEDNRIGLSLCRLLGTNNLTNPNHIVLDYSCRLNDEWRKSLLQKTRAYLVGDGQVWILSMSAPLSRLKQVSSSRGVQFIDFFSTAKKLNDVDKDILLTRMIVQSKTNSLIIHNPNYDNVSKRQKRKMLHEKLWGEGRQKALKLKGVEVKRLKF